MPALFFSALLFRNSRWFLAMQAFCNIQYLGKGYRKTEWNRVSVFNEATDSETHKTEYAYDADNRVTQVKYDGSDSTKVNYTYDKLNRITQRSVTNGAAYATQYGYAQGAAAYGSNATTPLINAITQGSGANALNFNYTYDSRGNITSETRNGVTTTYEYDALGQLIRVNDPNDTI